MSIDKRFITQRQGKDFVLYTGLIDEAHRQGLRRITTQLLQIPSESNHGVAIVHAQVETERGTFDGLGDASPANVGKMIAPHLLRMAETRAKARALRDALNVGVAALEELADEDEPVAQRRTAAVAAAPPVPEDRRPATQHMHEVLHGLLSQARALGADEEPIPPVLTIGEARTRKAHLVDVLAALHARDLPPVDDAAVVR